MGKQLRLSKAHQQVNNSVRSGRYNGPARRPPRLCPIGAPHSLRSSRAALKRIRDHLVETHRVRATSVNRSLPVYIVQLQCEQRCWHAPERRHLSVSCLAGYPRHLCPHRRCGRFFPSPWVIFCIKTVFKVPILNKSAFASPAAGLRPVFVHHCHINDSSFKSYTTHCTQLSRIKNYTLAVYYLYRRLHIY